MKRLLIICSILLSVSSEANTSNGELWNNANNFFQQNKYDSAARLYRALATQNPDNAQVFFNLGNAEYKLNNIGSAILNYEKALNIDPNNSLAHDNLQLAQNRINNRIQPIKSIFFIRWWNNITHSSNSNTYAILAVILFILSITYLIIARLGIINLSIPLQAKVGTFTIIGMLVLLSIVAGLKQIGSYKAIVMKNDASLLNSPKSNTSQSLIPEGTKVNIKTEDGEWTEIQLPDGRTGWMQTGLLSKI